MCPTRRAGPWRRGPGGAGCVTARGAHGWGSALRWRLAPNWRPMLGVASAIFAIGLAPVIIWNAQHGWATVHHLLGHLGLGGGDTSQASVGWRFDPRWILILLGSQLP